MRSSLVFSRFVVCALGLCGVGCGSSGGSGTVNGNVVGQVLAVHDVIWVSRIVTFSSGDNFAVVDIIASDQVDLCQKAKAGRALKSALTLTLDLIKPNATSITAGDYGETNDSKIAGSFAWETQYGPTCEQIKTGAFNGRNNNSVSGLVTLSSAPVAGEALSVTFDMTFGDQKDRLTGSFNAAACDLADSTAQNFAENIGSCE